MMFFVVVLGLVALSAAESDNTQKIQEDTVVHEQTKPVLHEPQQQVDDVNVIPFYKQIHNPYSLKMYGGYTPLRNVYGYNTQRFWDYPYRNFNGYNSQRFEDYPFIPYNYKNVMTYPYRNTFYLRYMNKLQPKVYYDSQDIYDYQEYDDQDVENQPLISIPFYRNQRVQKVDADIDSQYVMPYSPSYSQYNRGLINKYYSKNLDLLQNQQPLITKYYGKDLDMLQNQHPLISKYHGKNLDLTYNPLISKYYVQDLDQTSSEWYPVVGNHQGKNLEFDQAKPLTNYFHPLINKNVDLDVDLVQTSDERYPVVSNHQAKNLEFDQPKPLTDYFLGVSSIENMQNRFGKNLNQDEEVSSPRRVNFNSLRRVNFNSPRSENFNHGKPSSFRTMKNLDIESVRDITPINVVERKLPIVSSGNVENLDDLGFYPYYFYQSKSLTGYPY